MKSLFAILFPGLALCGTLLSCGVPSTYNPGDPASREYVEYQILRCLMGTCASTLFSSCPTLNWKDARADCWPTIQAHLQAQQALGSCGTPTITTVGTFSTSQKWSAGVLAVSGSVYGVSQNENRFLKIDPLTPSAAPSGTTISPVDGWRGGVLAFNEKIYGIPSNSAATMIEFEPVAETHVKFSGTPGVGNAYRGGVVAANGFIYALPAAATTIAKIDPVNRTVTSIASAAIGYWGGVLGPNGKIYGIPDSATTVLVIDPNNDTTYTIGNLSGNTGWAGGVLAPDGKIYAVPAGADSVLVIDPAADTVSNFTSGVLDATVEKWVSGALAANGKIYAMPGSGRATVLEIDPVNQTLSEYSSGHSARWWGAVSAMNGKIYGNPFTGTYAIQVDPCAFGAIDGNVLLSPFYNKF